MRFNYKTTSFSKDNLAYLAYCAKLVYKEEPEIQQELKEGGENVEVINNSDTDTQCLLIGDKDKIIIAFRGSATLTNWKKNAEIFKEDWVKGTKIHQGFYESFNSVWVELRQKIIELRTEHQSIWFTGHSLGGALAMLAATKMFLRNPDNVHGVYTFGQPRVGDYKFADFYDSVLKDRTYRVVNNNDVVTRIPFQNMGYSHVDRLLYFSEDGKLHTDDDLSWWGKFWDRVRGRIDDLLEPGLDGVKDHSMSIYCKLAQSVQ